MKPSIRSKRSLLAGLLAGVLLLAGCGEERARAGYRTLNPGYSRVSSRVLAREVQVPTRANLDYAAYSGNVMLWDSPADPVRLPQAPTAEGLRFGGLLNDPRASAEELPLTPAERASPFHWKPALDFLLENDFESTRPLAEAYGKVSAERWGFTGDAPPLVEFAELYVSAKDSSAWVKLEWKPWARPVPPGWKDADGDGFAEAYGRLDKTLFPPKLVALLRGEYSTRRLSEEETIDYGHQLAAYWYPSRNTDFQDLRGRGPWPAPEVEADVREEMKGSQVSQPLFALRGKPRGVPVYFVLRVPEMGAKAPVESRAASAASGRAVADNLAEYLASIRDRETSLLAEAGNGSWTAWSERLAPFRADVSSLLRSQPASVMAFKGPRDVLIFRRELEYLLAGDLRELPRNRNPIETIVALRDSLASLGIDFLFVPIPTKQDVYPGLVSRAGLRRAGGVAQPYLRKVLLDLSERQVETLDLLTLFQEAAAAEKESLYQRQDTHWSSRGLQAAAGLLAERVMSYAWFAEVYPEEIRYGTRDTSFGQLGDLYDRLPADLRAGLGPETVRGTQVVLPDGSPYQDSPEAPVLMLGDSYTGVFQLTGCRHAGVTAHLARALGGPVDLIMGWGGGPEAPAKLRRAGPEALQGKRLVIWVMSARDLFVYPGGWSR
jgi:hypothetical protein